MNRIDFTEYDRQTIAIFTYWNDKYDDLAKVAMPNWHAYAKRHKYFLRAYAPNGYHEDPTRLSTFGDKAKFQYYTDLRGHFATVMFLDVDSLFMNMDVTVQQVMLNHRFLWTYDDNGPLSGLWIASTDNTTERHLRRAYEIAPVENNVRHGSIEPNGISDQDAMTRLMNIPPFNQTFGYHNCLNAESVGHCYERNYKPGDWLITFPGLPVEDKLAKMKEWSDKANAAAHV